MISWLRNSLTGKLLFGVVAVLAGLTALAWLADPGNRSALRQAIDTPQTVAQNPAPVKPAAPEQPSEAEKIARLQSTIDTNRKQLDALKKLLEDPQSDYHQADTAFRKLDELLTRKQKELQALKAKGTSAASALLEKSTAALQTQWQEARGRFDLEIEQRKTVQEKVAALKRKIEQDRQALDQLTGASEEQGLLGSLVKLAAGSHHKGKPCCPVAAHASVRQAGPPPSPAPAARAEVTAAAPRDDAEENKKLERARAAARRKEAAAGVARQKAESINERMAGLRQSIAVEQRFLATARKKAALAQQSYDALNKEEESKREAHAAEAELLEGRKKLAEAAQRLAEANAAVNESNDNLSELHGELTALQAEQIAALREAEQKKREAMAADKKVAALENPFTLHKILQWFLNHGPRLLILLLGTVLLHRLVLLCTRRVVHLMTHHHRQHGRLDEENRAETLVGVFRNTASLVVLGGGTLMLLDEMSIPIVPLMGGAAVLGLAVAFGAQNLIKDYFCGFMVLVEDQYAVGDVVRIGAVEGKVERISLRITVLRDGLGVAHFIPHGTITTVSNMTHGWSCAFFEIGVAFKEDLDRVMDVLMDLADELCREEEFSVHVIEDPEMLGIDAIGDSSVTIKFFIKTKPTKQGLIRREMLRRIKRRFDQLGIEIPYPHRTLVHRNEIGPAPEQGRGEDDSRTAA